MCCWIYPTVCLGRGDSTVSSAVADIATALHHLETGTAAGECPWTEEEPEHAPVLKDLLLLKHLCLVSHPQLQHLQAEMLLSPNFQGKYHPHPDATVSWPLGINWRLCFDKCKQYFILPLQTEHCPGSGLKWSLYPRYSEWPVPCSGKQSWADLSNPIWRQTDPNAPL